MVKSLKNNKGFTLIELVMVIILVAILAAVAIPRFVDLSSDADDAASEGIIGGLRSGISIYYASTAAGGNAVNPTTPFDTTATGPMSAVPNLASNTLGNITDATSCAATALNPGEWAEDNAFTATTTRIFYRRRGDSDCMAWTYTSTGAGAGAIVEDPGSPYAG